jgi:hypothetical protein
LLKQILGDPNCQRRLQQKFVGGNPGYAGHCPPRRPPGTLTVNALEDVPMMLMRITWMTSLWALWMLELNRRLSLRMRPLLTIRVFVRPTSRLASVSS